MTIDIKKLVRENSAPSSEFSSNGHRINMLTHLESKPFQYHRNGWAWKDPNGSTVHLVRLSGPSGKRQNFENFMDKPSRHGTFNYERAHSVGDIFGAESPYGIGYLPKYVNQQTQKQGIEKHLKNLSEKHRSKDTDIYVTVTTEKYMDKGGFFIQSVGYRAEEVSAKETQQALMFETKISIDEERILKDGNMVSSAVSLYSVDGEKVSTQSIQRKAKVVDEWESDTQKDGFNKAAQGKQQKPAERGEKGSKQVKSTRHGLHGGPPPPKGPGMAVVRQQHREAMAKDHKKATGKSKPLPSKTESEKKPPQKGDLKKEFDRSR